MNNSRIAIIGAGDVGATTAYAILLKNIACEILLVDANQMHCKGQVLDLCDALPFYRSSTVRQATLQEAGSADIILIAAGARQKPGQSRTELLTANYTIMTSIIDGLQPISPDTIIIVISNPVDILTEFVQAKAGLPRNQVFGSGTLLDSLRLRGLLKEKTGIAEQSIQAFILGEHGDTQFPVWSSASIAGIPITQFPGITQPLLDEYANQSRQKAYDIIACKQATYFGVAACVANMCESILFNQRHVMPISTYLSNLGVCLSVPCVLGRGGIEQILRQGLDASELEKLAISAQAIKTIRDSIQG